MEAAELYHAETVRLPLRLASYEELRYEYNVVDVDQLPRRSGSRFHLDQRLLWCEGSDLFDGKRVFVPFEMVHTNYTTPLPDGHGCFVASSNGLASGNATMEAVSQGICEVVERDATVLWKCHYKKGLQKNRLDLATVDDGICQGLIAKIERAGLIVAVWDITSDIGIATFACVIIPRDDNTAWHCAAAAGYGCHPVCAIALSRALTEAAQTRLTVISGLRDDFGGDTYEQLLDPDVVRKMRHRIMASEPTRQFHEVPSWEGETFEDDVEWELECMARAGLRHVIVVDLTKTEFGLPIVRVIVPGLEPIPGSGCVLGERGRAMLRARS
jgi:ribosomal protein S12 methylthiotransferase accessory factor